MAVRLGIANVDAMARSLTAKQLLEWEAYEDLEPFGELRQDYRIASIVTMLANINRGKGKKAYTLEDFVVKFGEQEKKKQTWKEQANIMKLYARMHAVLEKAS